MAGNIKGITIEIGGSADGFKKALKEMNSATQSTQKELNAVNKSLKFAPKNVDLLKQKEQLLAKQIEDTKIKVEKLKSAKEKADKEMADGTEVNQEKYRQLVREISVAETQLKSLEKQNKETKKSANKTREAFVKAGKSIPAVSGAIIGIGTAAVGAMSTAAESTREYREDMNKLETAFKTGKFTVDAAKKSYEDFYVVLGETDRSVEAVNHLARFVTTEQDLAKWGDIAAGVTATFGDSLPIEGLTEASNETAKVGKVTGVLADALNWAGHNEDEFNKKLEKCNDEKERAKLITDTLDGAYKDAAVTYKELNADIIENRKATSESNDQMAKLGESTEAINTKLQQAKTTIVGAFLPVIGKVADKVSELNEGQIILLGGIGAAVTIVPKMITGLSQMATTVQTVKGVYDKLKVSATAASIATKAIPFIGVATAAVTLIGTVTALASATEEEASEANKLHEAQEQRYKDYKKLKQAGEENIKSGMEELVHIEKLKEELELLADESGRVKEADKARANFILNQLNDALGTEYTMTGNLIDNYDKLLVSINKALIAKKAEAILSGMEKTYTKAINGLTKEREEREKAVKALDEYTEKELKLIETEMKHLPESQWSQRTKDYKELTDTVEGCDKTIGEYTEAIDVYEDAFASYLEDGGAALHDAWAERNGMMTSMQREAATNYNQSLVDLADYEENYRKGIKGYTQAGLEEAQANVIAMKVECKKVGVAINEGVAEGVGNQETVKNAVDKLCDNIPTWAKQFLGINSPAKVAIPIGEAIPQGIGVGIEKDMSAEEALEKKCSNLKKILSDYTDNFDADIKLAKSEYDLWVSANPNANDDVKRDMERAMLMRTATGQNSTIQAINDALWILGETAGKDSKEYKEMLADLNEAKKDLNETNAKIRTLDTTLTPQYSEENVDLAESQYILWKARNPEATEYENLIQQEKKLNVEYEEQGKKVQDLNDELYQQIQLNGENSEESKKLLAQLNKEKAAYEELAREIANVNEQKEQYSGGGGLSYVAGGSPASKYAAYHVQYGAMLKSQGVSQEAIDAAARKASGYSGEKSINIINNNYGVTSDTAYKIRRENEKAVNNMAMQGVL